MKRRTLAAFAVTLALFLALFYWQERQIYRLRSEIRAVQQVLTEEDGSPDPSELHCATFSKNGLDK